MTVDYHHILGCTDFSELGNLALRKAASLAAAAGCKFTAMTVLPQPEMPSPLISHYEVQSDASLKKRAKEAAEAALLERIPDEVLAGATEVVCLVRIGDPTDEILTADVELKPDLIVLATHGRRGWSRFIMGSVAERVVQFAHADVLSVREPPPEPSAEEEE